MRSRVIIPRELLLVEIERRWDDVLTERDVPEWWEELTITGLHAVRENRDARPAEPSETVTRMSENFRRARRADETGEDSF